MTSARLRREAAALEAGWHPQTAIEVRAGAEREVILDHTGAQFRPMVNIPQNPPERREFDTVEFRIRLDLPELVADVPWSGPLQMQLISFWATEIRHDGRVVLAERLPLVAAGPAKFTVLEAPHPGDNGELAITVRTGRGRADGVHASQLLSFHLGTPALTDGFRTLDLAAAQLELAETLARDESERARVAAAVAEIDRIEGPLLYATAEVEQALRPLADILSRAREYEIACIGHSHIDLSWLWAPEDARLVQLRDLRSVADLMDDYPEFRFTHSQAAAYRTVQEQDPALFERLRARVQEGRLEPATMQWVESDTNIASGPASARQILEAVQWTRRELGVSPTVHLAPDTFGHAGNLPQLTCSAGATVYYHHRGNPGLAGGGEQWPAYWWEGDDRTRLLAISTPIYAGPLTAGRVVRDLIDAGVRRGRRLVCYFFGVGDHGGGPTRDDLDTLRLLRGADGFPAIASRTVAEYRDALLASGEEYPVHRGESMTVFEGCYVSHSDGKRANRDGETALVAAESLAALAGLEAGEEIDEAWRTVLFHQFHDIGGGSAIRVTFEDQVEQTAGVLAAAHALTGSALDALHRGHAGSWVVTNTTAERVTTPVVLDEAPRQPWVRDARGRTHPVQQTADGLSVLVLGLEPFETLGLTWSETGPQTASIEVTWSDGIFYEGQRLLTVETARFRYQVRPDSGVLTTLFDKTDGVEYLSFGEGMGRVAVQARPDLGFGVLQVLDELPHIMTAWVADELYRETSLLRGAPVEIVEHGPVRLVLRTRHAVRSSTVEVCMAIYAGLDRVDYTVDLDWQELGNFTDGHASLAMSFAARLGAAEAWYETPYAAARRPADGRLVPALRWADIGDGDHGFAVLNDGRYGHEALGSRLRVHLARGSYDPDALGDLGRHRVELSVLPHRGSWRDAGVVAAAAVRNSPPAVRRGSDESAPFPALWRPLLDAPAGIRVTELRPRGTGGIMLRLAEAHGVGGTARLALPEGARAGLAGIDEQLLGPVDLVDGVAVIRLPPFAVRTLLIDRSPIPARPDDGGR